MFRFRGGFLLCLFDLVLFFVVFRLLLLMMAISSWSAPSDNVIALPHGSSVRFGRFSFLNVGCLCCWYPYMNVANVHGNLSQYGFCLFGSVAYQIASAYHACLFRLSRSRGLIGWKSVLSGRLPWLVARWR